MTMRRCTSLLAIAIAMLACWAASADAAPTWQWAPALAPAPPAGVAPAPYPIALGHIGQLSFWSPNRGLLITAGTPAAPAGLYAYDGVSWHQLSTVCGATDGRIAWAGPDEFWTISDQRAGQLGTLGSGVVGLAGPDASLCHFKDGQVVASYALPLGQPNSYLPMDAAACVSPSNCWFGGQTGIGTEHGAFHLHWDGTTMAQLYAPQDQPISSMAAVQNQLFEGIRPSGPWVSDTPPVLHQIVTADTADPFHLVLPADSACAGQPVCPALPAFGTDAAHHAVDPTTLGPLALATDWTLGGVNGGAAPQLWVAVAPKPGAQATTAHGVGHSIVLRFASGRWTQVVPARDALPAVGEPTAIAAEPSAAAAWMSMTAADLDGSAHVVRLAADGTAGGTATLGPDQGVGQRGNAGPIACPAANDCWLATDQGWLFHLTDGTRLPQDTDPSFQRVITFRPPDPSTPNVLPDSVPPDDSGADLPPDQLPDPAALAPSEPSSAAPKKPLALVAKTQSRLVHRTTLALTITLRAKAHVQLIAKRKKHVVAKTKNYTLKTGRHTIHLALNRKHWPTSLQLKASAIGAPPTTAEPFGAAASVTRAVVAAQRPRP